jgi:hypothetical protein
VQLVTTLYILLLNIHKYPQSRLQCRCSVAVARLPTAGAPFLLVPKLSPCLSHSNPSSLAALHTVHITTAHATLASDSRLNQNKFKFKLFCDRRSVGQFVLVSGPHLGPMTTFFLLSDICGLRVHVLGKSMIIFPALPPVCPDRLWGVYRISCGTSDGLFLRG